MGATSVAILHFDRCGCAYTMSVPQVILNVYITHDSPISPFDPDFEQYEDETNEGYNFDAELESNVTPMRLIQIEDAPDINAMAYFVGVQDNGNGTSTDYKFTPSQLVNYVAGQMSIMAVCTSTGAVHNFAWAIDKEIKTITYGGIVYFMDEDFTQLGQELTWINGMEFTTDRTVKLSII